jgi:tyrosinase
MAQTRPLNCFPFVGVQSGIKTENGQKVYPLRRDIEEWSSSENEDDKAQVNLFIQGLAAFQAMPFTDLLSYYRIAGIHGEPYGGWYEDRKEKKPYCTHGSILFPSWHRPYLALYEQLIHDHMTKIAKQYRGDERTTYLRVAETWRLPFWDPAQVRDKHFYNGVGIPSLVTFPVMDVYCPPPENGGDKGVWKTIRNPLYSFQFHNQWNSQEDDQKVKVKSGLMEKRIDDDKVTPFDRCMVTVRQPTGWGPKDEWKQNWSKTQNNYYILEILRESASFREDTYDVLTKPKEYTTFATTAKTAVKGSGTDGDKAISLEDIHNSIHDFVGGKGHMGSVPVAAFDPLFWLHHCNIDRWAAIWQTLPGHDDPSKPWWVPKGDQPKPEDELKPFKKDEHHYYTSNDVRDWTKLGYSYPELQNGKTVGSPEYIQELIKSVNDLYGALFDEFMQRPPAKALVCSEHATTIHFDDYVAVADYERFALGGKPFSIYFFLGKFDDSENANFSTDSSLVGSIFNFVSPAQQNSGSSKAVCENCEVQANGGMKITGSVNLTQAIIEAILDPSIEGEKPKSLNDRDGVEKFLTKFLSWRVASTESDDIGLKSRAMNSLTIRISRARATLHTDKTKLIEYGQYEDVPSITHGRPRGLLFPS